VPRSSGRIRCLCLSPNGRCQEGLEESVASVCHTLDGAKRLWRNPLRLFVTQWTVPTGSGGIRCLCLSPSGRGQEVLEESSASVCHPVRGANRFWRNPMPLSVIQWTVPRGSGGILCLCLSSSGRCQEVLEESSASVCRPVDGVKRFWRNPLPLSVIQWTVPRGSEGILCLCLSPSGRCQHVLEESSVSVCRPVDGANRFWRKPLPLFATQWTVPRGSGGILCLCLSSSGRCQEFLEEYSAPVCRPVDGTKRFWRNLLPLSVAQWTVPTGSEVIRCLCLSPSGRCQEVLEESSASVCHPVDGAKRF